MYALVKSFIPLPLLHAGPYVQYKTNDADEGAGAGSANQDG